MYRATAEKYVSRSASTNRRLGAGEIGLLASVGKAQVPVFAMPEVAILPTGDEVVPVEQRPEWFQIRNSNALTLAAQVEKAGGVPRLLGIAPDEKEALRGMILLRPLPHPAGDRTQDLRPRRSGSPLRSRGVGAHRTP